MLIADLHLILTLNVCFAFAGALDDGGKQQVPDMFVTKYNSFVDGIYERINSILKSNYDPVNVKLSMESAELKTSAGKKTQKK
jgi:hypothetical protein